MRSSPRCVISNDLIACCCSACAHNRMQISSQSTAQEASCLCSQCGRQSRCCCLMQVIIHVGVNNKVTIPMYQLGRGLLCRADTRSPGWGHLRALPLHRARCSSHVLTRAPAMPWQFSVRSDALAVPRVPPPFRVHSCHRPPLDHGGQGPPAGDCTETGGRPGPDARLVSSTECTRCHIVG
jgi:hypothetical protein